MSDTIHETRTAKVVELVGSSTESFQDAVECAIRDASATTRHIQGADVDHMTVKCEDGKIIEYRVALKLAFGIERQGQGEGNIGNEQRGTTRPDQNTGGGNR